MLTNPNKGETAVHDYGPTFISVLVVLVSRKVIFIYVVSTLQLCSKNVCIITSATESESRDNEICAFCHGNAWFYLKCFFIPVYELKCSYGEISSPVAEIAVRGMTRQQGEISVTGPVRSTALLRRGPGNETDYPACQRKTAAWNWPYWSERIIGADNQSRRKNIL